MRDLSKGVKAALSPLCVECLEYLRVSIFWTSMGLSKPEQGQLSLYMEGYENLKRYKLDAGFILALVLSMEDSCMRILFEEDKVN